MGKLDFDTCSLYQTVLADWELHLLGIVDLLFNYLITRKPVDPLEKFIHIEICLIFLQFLFALLIDPFRHSNPDPLSIPAHKVICDIIRTPSLNLKHLIHVIKLSGIIARNGNTCKICRGLPRGWTTQYLPVWFDNHI